MKISNYNILRIITKRQKAIQLAILNSNGLKMFWEKVEI